jgi:hypothetical protein
MNIKHIILLIGSGFFAAVFGVIAFMYILSRFFGSDANPVDMSLADIDEAEVQVKFVEIDPDSPITIPKGTVGGVTACERLYNLKQCLQEKNKDLVPAIAKAEKNATNSATIEDGCGETLIVLNDLREQSIKSGCVW